MKGGLDGARTTLPVGSPHSSATKLGTTRILARPSAQWIIFLLLAASVQSRLGYGVMPSSTGPRFLVEIFKDGKRSGREVVHDETVVETMVHGQPPWSFSKW